MPDEEETRQKPLEREPTGELVRRALDEARGLVTAELALARAEVKGDLDAVVRAAVGFGAAAGVVIAGVAVLAVAGVLATGGSPVAALGVGLGMLLVGGGAFAYGYYTLPKKPLGRTRAHVQKDVQRLKEHVA